ITHSVYSANERLDEQIYFDLRKQLGFKNIVPIIESAVYISQFPNEQFRIIGIDPFSENSQLSFLEAGNIRLNSKSFKLFLTEENGAIISSRLMSGLGLKTGDAFMISAGSQKEVKVIATIDTAVNKSTAFTNNKIFVDIATAQNLLDFKGKITRIDLNLSGYSKQKIGDIKHFLSSGYPQTSLIRLGSLEKQRSKLTKSFELNLTALSLITLLIAFFLIYNSFNYSLVIRRPVFSVLRSIGVTSNEIFRLILTEALIIGLVSSVIGIALGVFLGQFSVLLVSNTLSSIYSVFGQTGFDLSSLTILKAILIGVTAVLSAALIPSLESRFIKPLSLSSGSYFNKNFLRFVPYLLTTGVILIFSGLYISAFLSSNITLTFVGLFIIIIGYTLVLPALMVVLAGIINRFAKPLLGKIYLIPCRNYLSSIDKNYVATASLTVAVAVFLSMTVLIESFRTTLTAWLDDTFSSDVFISAAGRPGGNNGLDFSLLDIVSGVSGTADIGYSRKINLLTERYGKLNLIALSENPPIKPQIISGLVNEFSGFIKIDDNAVLISESFSNRYKDKLKDGYLSISTKKGEKKFLIAGVFSDFATQTGTLIIGYDLFKNFWDDDKLTSVSLNVSPGYELNTVLNSIRAGLSGERELRLSTNKDLKDSAHRIFNQTFAITNAMRVIAFAVAFFGILGALLALELSRKKEIGVLRSLGVKVSEIRKIIFSETGIIGLLSGIVSIPLGLTMAYLLVNVINFKSFGWTINFVIKPGYLAEAVLISFIAAMLAGIYPSVIFSKINISEAIREE
ncbi:MAG: FtsX-like permease family protein, partial [Candidatus Dadabacteria bacterium]|nr:FtsX-like permease family protein [Candidatus Dadabacteria bacterium]NIS09102.1 FtsX-like permease family protein [Candidatus Dadabacteria bacterium]NIV41538.1 FtsX-like permease family protein [Candidatus Dadabacteria bacterium]NIX15219.1 FtsX-like permease family protein [Candidatus Dadabacteria bacterium]NIY21863.1 FtsX-like permease family protein [Candidatus Dadabacteria bacterium]